MKVGEALEKDKESESNLDFDKIYMDAIQSVDRMEENISQNEAELKEHEEYIEEKKKEKKNQFNSTVILFVLLVVILACSYLGVNCYKPYKAYKTAVSYMEEGKYSSAADVFNTIKDYKDSAELLKDCKYEQAVTLYENQDYTQALILLGDIGDYKDSQKLIADLVGIRKDVLAVGLNHSVGLKSIGRVVAVGDNTYGQCDVEGWQDIVAVSAGKNHTVGITSQGRAVAVGDNRKGQCDVSAWDNLAAIQASNDFTIGLKTDGTLVTTGEILNINEYRQLKDVAEISCYNGYTVCLLKNGDVVYIGNGNAKTLSKLKGCTTVACGNGFAAGITAENNLVLYGRESDVTSIPNIKYVELSDDIFVVDGEHNVYSTITGFDGALIVALGENHSIALMSDGTVKAVGDNSMGQCDTQIWRDIALK